MSGFAFDTGIVIDVLLGIEQGRAELRRAVSQTGRAWLSRMAWIEIMSKSSGAELRDMERFLSGFAIDEIDSEISDRAAALRRERKGIRLPDAVILATALVRGRVLVTRNTRDFPAEMPGIRIPYTL
ncbi:PIN domain-containing protein [Pelagerythrobacter aerophilus]|uniref:Type II toxin-antitoxin system VapC family toxin n=1 Tax=Pelagerythrobacter aerophilus TaxID=2306995 RepID=A0A418NI31_9SPHN|nr:PIN domain-containing protein [Pelagerythrobacter aerophilus]RIV78628.1 type II toxin-antitoxin system VapC family toxin [Pelagerythrobacter aerophilus]